MGGGLVNPAPCLVPLLAPEFLPRAAMKEQRESFWGGGSLPAHSPHVPMDQSQSSVPPWHLVLNPLLPPQPPVNCRGNDFLHSPQHSSAPQLLMGLCSQPQQENIPIPLLLGAGWVSASVTLPGERWDQQHPSVRTSGCASAAAF